MIARPATLLALLLSPALAVGEGRSEVMLDLLGRVPTEILEPEPGSYAQVHFVDNRVAGRLAGLGAAEGSFAERAGPYARATTMPLGRSILLALDGGWESRVGFGPLDVEALVDYALPPEKALLLQLDPAAAERVAPALLAHGYAEAQRNGLSALSRGEEDNSIDLSRRDPADPFGGDLGQSSRVIVESPFVLQASTWPALRDLASPDGQRGHPDLVAMAEVLDLPEWGDAELVQAIALPHQVDVSSLGTGGIPLWRLGLLADLDSGEDRFALALFSYTSQPDAVAAARRVVEGWGAAPAFSPLEEIVESPEGSTRPEPSPAGFTGAEVTTGVAGNGPFVTWAAIRPSQETSADPLSNPGFQRVLDLIFRREMAIFGPP